MPLLSTAALPQSEKRTAPIRVSCRSLILSSSLRTNVVLISRATTSMRAGFPRMACPNAKFAAVLSAASPPLHPMPWSNTFSTWCLMPKPCTTKWSYPGFALFVHVVETMCVIWDRSIRASAMAFRAALTARGTPSLRKISWSSRMDGAFSLFTKGWSGVPIEERLSIPVNRLIESTFCILSSRRQQRQGEWGEKGPLTMLIRGRIACSRHPMRLR